jgi:hypothetical protein
MLLTTCYKTVTLTSRLEYQELKLPNLLLFNSRCGCSCNIKVKRLSHKSSFVTVTQRRAYVTYAGNLQITGGRLEYIYIIYVV